MVCIAHTGAACENDPWRRGGPLELGFPRKVACMTREYLGHPQKQMAPETRCTSWYPGGYSVIRCTPVKGSSMCQIR